MPQGRYQLSRGDPSGSLVFAGGQMSPATDPPLSSAMLGGDWKVPRLGDGRSKSGLKLHIAFLAGHCKLSPVPRVRL